MRIPSPFVRCLLVLCTLLLVPACSAMRGGGGETIAVTVNNDLLPSTAVTVWMVPETGARRQLGTMAPGAEQTFSFRPSGATGRYRLVAEHVGGGTTSSGLVVLTGLRSIHWDLSSPAIRMGETRNSP